MYFLTRTKESKNKQKTKSIIFLLSFSLFHTGCATHGKDIAVGMGIGAGVGAAAGYQFIHHGENRKNESRNTIMSSIIFALVTGGVLAWHYNELEEMKVELSGQYARYRLCDPEENQIQFSRELGGPNSSNSCSVHQFEASQVEESTISLDDHTKWQFPRFRKRLLNPERSKDSILSQRYLWEIIQPGQFVTRSQNPEFFSVPESKNKKVKSPHEKNE